mmetsp:Transcript_20139/g.43307  ORF Transcript_20139/g.43307 Transcript_20139/m.43307 type:complete len:299 (+) Transcript_20139:48-944(+)
MCTKLFLGGLTPSTTRWMLEEYFGQFGCVAEAMVAYQGVQSRGFGFVNYYTIAEAERACSCGPHVIDGRVVDVKFAVPKDEVQSNKVFVGGLPHECTTDALSEYFGMYGTVVDATIQRDRRTNRSRGFGFVRFLRNSSVELVMKHYDKHAIQGKWVDVKRAVPEADIAPTSEPLRAPTPPPAQIAVAYHEVLAMQAALSGLAAQELALRQAAAAAQMMAELQVAASWRAPVFDLPSPTSDTTVDDSSSIGAPPGLEIYEDEVQAKAEKVAAPVRSPLAPLNNREWNTHKVPVDLGCCM